MLARQGHVDEVFDRAEAIVRGCLRVVGLERHGRAVAGNLLREEVPTMLQQGQQGWTQWARGFLAALSIRELKAVAAASEASLLGCVEKSEIVDKVLACIRIVASSR